jgi:hypothetical protein
MRVLMNVSFPVEQFNNRVRDGSADKRIAQALEAIKPEAVYFTEHDGQRGAVIVVNMNDASQIPALAEPWFLGFNAKCEFRIAMTPDDLKRAGLDALGKKWA